MQDKYESQHWSQKQEAKTSRSRWWRCISRHLAMLTVLQVTWASIFMGRINYITCWCYGVYDCTPLPLTTQESFEAFSWSSSDEKLQGFSDSCLRFRLRLHTPQIPYTNTHMHSHTLSRQQETVRDRLLWWTSDVDKEEENAPRNYSLALNST